MRSFAIDECLAPEWGKPSGVPGQTVGEAVLAGIGLLYPFKWVWIDLGALVALFWAWNGVTYLAMLLLGGAPLPLSPALLSEHGGYSARLRSARPCPEAVGRIHSLGAEVSNLVCIDGGLHA